MKSHFAPSGPVRYVVPFRAGGPPDAIARIVAPALSQLWARDVRVDNIPGDNGNAGSEIVAHSEGDGCTLLQGTSATHGSNAVLFPQLSFDPQRDLIPVVQLIEGPLYLAASEGQPFQCVEDLLDCARRFPGRIRFATAGPGSPHHLAGELLKVRAGIDITPVHYVGAAHALEALLRREVEIYFGSDFSAHPDAGRLTILAVSTRWRWPFAAHVPTLIERGVADFEMHGWFGIFAPASAATSIVDALNADVNAVLAIEPVSREIYAYGYRIMGGTAVDFARCLHRESIYWKQLLQVNRLNVA